MSLLPQVHNTLKLEVYFTLESAEEFGDFFTQTHRLVFKYIYGLHNGSIEVIEDLTAETYLRAWKSRQRFQGDEKAAVGWLLTIAKNLVINQNRRRNLFRLLDEKIENQVSLSTSLSPEDLFLRNEQHQTLRHLLQKLPVKQREILILRYLLDWRVKDIAQRFDMPENTVSVYIRRTLQQICGDWPQS